MAQGLGPDGAGRVSVLQEERAAVVPGGGPALASSVALQVVG